MQSLGFRFKILVWDTGLSFRFDVQVWNKILDLGLRCGFGFRFAIQVWVSAFVFTWGFQV